MTRCPSCGYKQRDKGRFCRRCGVRIDAPQPVAVPPKQQFSQGRRMTIGAVLAGVAVLAVAFVVFVVPRLGNAAAQNTVIPTTPTATSTTAPTTTTEEPTTTTTTVTTTVSESDLEQLVAADRTTAESLVGQWVPQISSKNVGLTVNGVTYGYPEIMADYKALQVKYPPAIMVKSDDYTNFSGPGFWVTIIPTPYSTPDAANAWCDSAGFGVKDCYASRLMHTGGPDGNSKVRG